MVAYHNKQHLGYVAEQAASNFLQKKGLRLIQHHYHCFQGEIDLIMQDGNDIVFIEVRSRHHSQYGSAIESINKTKQKKIIKTALHFLQKEKWLHKVNCRFDVVGIQTHLNSPIFEWIKNAFWADENFF